MEIKTIDDLLKKLKEVRGPRPMSHELLSYGCGRHDGLKYASLLVKKFKQHLDHYRWRKVEDELPNECVEVLIRNEWDSYYLAFLESNLGYFYADHLRLTMSIHDVTHWRYLDIPDED